MVQIIYCLFRLFANHRLSLMTCRFFICAFDSMWVRTVGGESPTLSLDEAVRKYMQPWRSTESPPDCCPEGAQLCWCLEGGVWRKSPTLTPAEAACQASGLSLSVWWLRKPSRPNRSLLQLGSEGSQSKIHLFNYPQIF